MDEEDPTTPMPTYPHTAIHEADPNQSDPGSNPVASRSLHPFLSPPPRAWAGPAAGGATAAADVKDSDKAPALIVVQRLMVFRLLESLGNDHELVSHPARPLDDLAALLSAGGGSAGSGPAAVPGGGGGDVEEVIERCMGSLLGALGNAIDLMFADDAEAGDDDSMQFMERAVLLQVRGNAFPRVWACVFMLRSEDRRLYTYI